MKQKAEILRKIRAVILKARLAELEGNKVEECKLCKEAKALMEEVFPLIDDLEQVEEGKFLAGKLGEKIAELEGEVN